jgi:hydroxymethylpyrimidine pyrophosphatase-like HAD family hydrolase
MQARAYNTPLKVSAFLHETPDPDAAARKIQRRVAHAPDGAGYQVVYSSGMHLDIIPAVAGKGNAIRFVLAQCNLPADNVIVAGDSGNDRSMFDSFSQGIIVANAQPELKEVAAAGDSQHYLAQAPYAAGVLEGLRHFGRL